MGLLKKISKRKLIIMFIIIIGLVMLKGFFIQETRKGKAMRLSRYKFLKESKNRMDVYYSALKLNGGNSKNTCVYFVSEVLRRNNYNIPVETANTNQLLTILKKHNWKKGFDFKDLKKGDICFTTDENGFNTKPPTHVYIFMEWVKEGKYDYAYICDNQAKDYENKIYHIRNISNIDKQINKSKDAFNFFVRN